MPRYPECVWSGAKELEHIEIVGRRGKVLEDCGRHWKAWKNVRSCERHWKLQKMSERVGKCRKLRNVWLVTGKTSEGLCDRSGHVTVCDAYTYLMISVLFFISAILYISLFLQVNPYSFLFRSPARDAFCLVYLLHNKLKTSDPLLVLHSADHNSLYSWPMWSLWGFFVIQHILQLQLEVQ